MRTNEYILLKWGTLKAWENLTEKSGELLAQFFKDGMSMSCAMDKPDEERKHILCELIDQLNGDIWNDWDNVQLSKEAAKKYVLEYGASTAKTLS